MIGTKLHCVPTGALIAGWCVGANWEATGDDYVIGMVLVLKVSKLAPMERDLLFALARWRPGTVVHSIRC